jgi:hypothetical protein
MPHGIFVSHITAEAPIALVLKNWITSTFSGQCEVFVSSDQGDLLAGTRWLVQLEQAMESAKVFLVLCSPASVHRPWINFETGCAWIRHVPTIPLCHSGQTTGTLPSPLSALQALEIEASDFTQVFLSSLARHLDIATIPQISHAEMAAELQSALAACQQTPPAQTASFPTTPHPVFENFVAFCEEYAARVQRGKVELSAYGPWASDVTFSFAVDLGAIRQRHALWVQPEVREKLKPFEQALRSLAIDARLTREGGATPERQSIIARAVRTFSQILGEPMERGHERPEINTDHVIDYLQESIRNADG